MRTRNAIYVNSVKLKDFQLKCINVVCVVCCVYLAVKRTQYTEWSTHSLRHCVGEVFHFSSFHWSGYIRLITGVSIVCCQRQDTIIRHCCFYRQQFTGTIVYRRIVCRYLFIKYTYYKVLQSFASKSTLLQTFGWSLYHALFYRHLSLLIIFLSVVLLAFIKFLIRPNKLEIY